MRPGSLAAEGRSRTVDFDTLEGLDHCDVAHRMVQPDQWFSVDRGDGRRSRGRDGPGSHCISEWRLPRGHREVALIGRHFARAPSAADAVVIISEDVKIQVEMERLAHRSAATACDPLRHGATLRATNSRRCLRTRGARVRRRSVHLCLGTDYAHKNRDLALAVSQISTERGHSHALVMAGPTVPYGSSRLSEANSCCTIARRSSRTVFLLPDLPSPNATGSSVMPIWCCIRPRLRDSDSFRSRQHVSERQPCSPVLAPGRARA